MQTTRVQKMEKSISVIRDMPYGDTELRDKWIASIEQQAKDLANAKCFADIGETRCLCLNYKACGNCSFFADKKSVDMHSIMDAHRTLVGMGLAKNKESVNENYEEYFL